MWLLPDEDLLLKDADFLTIHETLEGKYAVCTGRCDRKLRPIACRIFPYFPLLFRTRAGTHSVKPMPDPRALATCALFSSGRAGDQPRVSTGGPSCRYAHVTGPFHSRMAFLHQRLLV